MAVASQQLIKWQLKSLPKSTRQALDFLSAQNWLRSTSWYLAGGTALALQVGHRSSVDLDFFCPEKEFSAEELLGHFSSEQWTTDILRAGTIYGKIKNAKTSFIAYPFFFPRQVFLQYGAVSVLDKRDIAVMKIVAISQRGRKRDFFDLFWYCLKVEQLLDVLQRLPDQYPTVAHDYHHILKSLNYFVDAEEDPMPKLFFKASWKEIKAFFQREVPRVTKQLLRL